MENVFKTFLTLFSLTATLEAALPPLYQNRNEISAILSSPEFGQKLQSGEAILTIQKNETGYLITTNKNVLQVNVIYKHSDKMGPVPFDLKFEEPHHIP